MVRATRVVYTPAVKISATGKKNGNEKGWNCRSVIGDTCRPLGITTSPENKWSFSRIFPFFFENLISLSILGSCCYLCITSPAPTTRFMSTLSLNIADIKRSIARILISFDLLVWRLGWARYSDGMKWLLISGDDDGEEANGVHGCWAQSIANGRIFGFYTR